MLIDWFTVGAQTLNFLILVWLMHRFLYAPVLAAIAAREKRIADQIAAATSKETDAANEQQAFSEKSALFDNSRAELLAQATEQAKVRGEKIVEEARKAAADLRLKREEVLTTQTKQLHRDIGDKARQEVFAIARRALGDLATQSLEACMADVFVRKLQQLPASTQAAMDAALKESKEPALLRSAFPLPEAERAVLQQALGTAFSPEFELRFETAGALIGGIELSVGGQKLAWSIDGYLKALEQGVQDLLAERAAPSRQASEAPPTPQAPPQSAPLLLASPQ